MTETLYAKPPSLIWTLSEPRAVFEFDRDATETAFRERAFARGIDDSLDVAGHRHEIGIAEARLHNFVEPHPTAHEGCCNGPCEGILRHG